MSGLNVEQVRTHHITKRGRRRLEILETLLRNDLPAGFDFNINAFGVHDLSHEPDEHHTCGTAACAVGLAALSPKLPGLHARWEEVMGIHRLRVHDRISEKFVGASIYHDDWAVVCRYFGLNYKQTEWLFEPSSYLNLIRTIRPIDVAKRIRRILEGGGPRIIWLD